MQSGGDGGAMVEETGGTSGGTGSSEAGAQMDETGGGGGGGGGGSGGGGNRWPRQETLALLKIRSDMDAVFKDSNLKGPLWEEVSRKLAELGYQRNAKKCKEKFENVFKYHKRTKDGRQAKPDSKSYRFFDQLEALENTPPPAFAPPSVSPGATSAMAQLIAATSLPSHGNVTSTTSAPTPLSVVVPHTQSSPMNIASFQQTIHMPPHPSANPQNPPLVLSNSTSSSTSSDEDIQRRRGKKRKWKDYFERLLSDVIQKQEEMQNRFLETLEKREKDRMAREEAWRVQEMARLNREHELLVNERSVAAAKDAAVISFLQKVTEQHDIQLPITKNANAQSPLVPNHVPLRVENPQQPLEKPQPPPPPQQSSFQPPPQPAITVTPMKATVQAAKMDNGGDSLSAPSSSRWPKAEIEALIKLRTDLELKYQDNSPKGPLWEEISLGMGRLGYSRSSKRCKEKWENINKYYKKVKESSKKRPEDSKTCPYFNQLDALYKQKAKTEVASSFNVPGFSNNVAPIMAQPEQQWPVAAPQQQTQQDSVMHEKNHNESENNQNEDDDEGYDDEEEDDGRRFEVVPNKQQIPGTS